MSRQVGPIAENRERIRADSARPQRNSVTDPGSRVRLGIKEVAEALSWEDHRPRRHIEVGLQMEKFTSHECPLNLQPSSLGRQQNMAFDRKHVPFNIRPPADGLFNAALDIAERRREILVRMRAAVKANNVAAIVAAAKELVGYDNKTSDRTNPRKHARTGRG